MNDRDIVRRCAEAMGYTTISEHPSLPVMLVKEVRETYSPLNSDAQAMALVKRFRMTIVSMHYDEKWHAIIPSAQFNCDAISPDLNRAICTAVANMQEAK